jgi:hypothetical protein
MESREGIKAVIFDLGGVVFPSPFGAIAQYASTCDPPIPSRALNMILGRSDGAFALLEATQITVAEFHVKLEKEVSIC